MGYVLVSKDNLSTQFVERTQHALSASVQNVCVDHRRRHIRMAQQLLHRPDVVTGQQKMCCERVTKTMTVRLFRDPGLLRRGLYCLLQTVLMHVVPASLATAWIDR